MLRPRIIPCLLIHNGGLVKTQKFKDPKYVGDPMNAVKIFNDKEADELIVLDIDATVNGAPPDFGLIAKLAEECRMPLCYGGGVKTADQAEKIIDMGVEKVSVSSAALEDPSLLEKMAARVGRQSVVTVIDVRIRKGLFSKGYQVCSHNAAKSYGWELSGLLETLQNAGAGEIVVNSIDRDGCMNGYDLDLAALVRNKLRIPVSYLGGAGSLDDIGALIATCGVVGAAAGSLFVFKGKYRAVLINYPPLGDKDRLSSRIEAGARQ